MMVGLIDCDLLKKSGKTEKFTRQDFEILMRFLSRFPSQITTPPVITEACNLLDTLNRQTSYHAFKAIRAYLEKTKESRSESRYLATMPIFPALGLADSSLYALASRGVLILTDDLELFGHIISRRLPAMNFNHLLSEDTF